MNKRKTLLLCSSGRYSYSVLTQHRSAIFDGTSTIEFTRYLLIPHYPKHCVEESIGMTEDRDKWRKYVYGVSNPRIEDG